MGGSVSQDSIDQAVLDLKITRDKLKLYQKQQERFQEVELQKARELVKKGQKDRAKIVLKQKKAREIYINNSENMIQGIENQINNIQTKKMQIDMISNIKQANALLKKMNDLMPIEEVEKIMDENKDQNDRLNEIQNLLAQDQDQYIDNDSELDKMLEELDIGEVSENKLANKEKPQKIVMSA